VPKYYLEFSKFEVKEQAYDKVFDIEVSLFG
jgi:hypothetical protein